MDENTAPKGKPLPRREEYLKKLESFQATPFSAALQDCERTRLVMCETNLFCRDTLKERGRKIDDVPTYGEYLAYLKHKLLVQKDTDIANIPANDIGLVHSNVIASSLNMLAPKREDAATPSDAILNSQLQRKSTDHFKYITQYLQERLEEEKATLDFLRKHGRNKSEPLTTPLSDVITWGAQTYENMRKSDSKARRLKVIELKSRGLSVDEIDFILNGPKPTPITSKPKPDTDNNTPPAKHGLEDFIADISERETHGYNPVTKPSGNNHEDKHQSIIDRLKGHLDVLSAVADQYDTIFINGRASGIT
ncbi:MAG: hypothetical protein SFW63_05255 [Alphaproteobacteria bacterium]|nr:hypothetical protein [Alphaproteobacteria bacterium]